MATESALLIRVCDQIIAAGELLSITDDEREEWEQETRGFVAVVAPAQTVPPKESLSVNQSFAEKLQAMLDATPAKKSSTLPFLTKKAKLRARQAALKLKQEQENQQAEIQLVDPLVEPDEPEPISFAEAARRLGKGVKLVRRRFMKMPGVIKIPGVPRKGKRKYYNWAIPLALFEAVKKSWEVK